MPITHYAIIFQANLFYFVQNYATYTSRAGDGRLSAGVQVTNSGELAVDVFYFKGSVGKFFGLGGRGLTKVLGKCRGYCLTDRSVHDIVLPILYFLQFNKFVQKLTGIIN